MYMLFILLCFSSKLKEIQMFPFVKNVTFRKNNLPFAKEGYAGALKWSSQTLSFMCYCSSLSETEYERSQNTNINMSIIPIWFIIGMQNCLKFIPC